MSLTDPCPCGLPANYAECCGRYHEGQPAPTAEALMRSRYSAYARGLIAYVVSTTHPDHRDADLESQIRAWADDVAWVRLEVHTRSRGGVGDKIGKVEFSAHYVHENTPQTHRELSRFKRYKGRWYYVDGVMK